ncbi:MAG: hypothetical protein Q9208_008276 [Pyrenodesmia sp. 3 TL-2023]
MTKRAVSEDEGFVRPQPRKRVAFTKPKASTKATIARNAITSPLLRLPLELREQIWTHVLGERLIHLKYDPTAEDPEHRPVFSLEFSLSSYGGYERIILRHYTEMNGNIWSASIVVPRMVRDEDDKDVGKWQESHDECHLHDYDPHSLPPRRPADLSGNSTMHLTVLRASRQIYVEANRILWATNTFSFNDAPSFEEFMKTRNAHQKRLINTLRFEMHWGSSEAKQWNSVLNMTLVKSLTGLRTLHLPITYNIKKHLWDLVKNNFVQQASYTQGLRKLSMLPLTNAEVVIRTSPPRHRCLPPAGWEKGLWQRSDMDHCANELRQLLVNPMGAEIYAQHQAEFRIMSARNRWIKLQYADNIIFSDPHIIP